MHGWSCPIRLILLIGRNSLHFENNTFVTIRMNFWIRCKSLGIQYVSQLSWVEIKCVAKKTVKAVFNHIYCCCFMLHAICFGRWNYPHRYWFRSNNRPKCWELYSYIITKCALLAFLRNFLSHMETVDIAAGLNKYRNCSRGQFITNMIVTENSHTER